MNTEFFYDLFEACNGRWRDFHGNMLMFFRPDKQLDGTAIFQSLEGFIHPLRYEIKSNDGESIVQLGNRVFNLSLSDDGVSMQFEREGRVTFYTLK
ncbi:hypothetical protein [Chryseolinea sp. H1M3-3]|uniref:hypothetical protein n=1 Tax=Chryseolinea sp. H1M3-3 TaxID=3034144 RepID=UPI0023EB1E83|nr:hypothetical protein [Chryseolinea sp. H1M3-3]